MNRRHVLLSAAAAASTLAAPAPFAASRAVIRLIVVADQGAATVLAAGRLTNAFELNVDCCSSSYRPSSYAEPRQSSQSRSGLATFARVSRRARSWVPDLR